MHAHGNRPHCGLATPPMSIGKNDAERETFVAWPHVLGSQLGAGGTEVRICSPSPSPHASTVGFVFSTKSHLLFRKHLQTHRAPFGEERGVNRRGKEP